MVVMRNQPKGARSASFGLGLCIFALMPTEIGYQGTHAYRLNQFVDTWGIVPDDLHVISLLTSMFLHGGWLHLLGNMLFLWVFGRNLEDLIGGSRFLVFYIVCGLAAGVVQVLANPYSRLPTIGASGAIAGVMGAYLVLYPRVRIKTLVLLIIIPLIFDLSA